MKKFQNLQKFKKKLENSQRKSKNFNFSKKITKVQIFFFKILTNFQEFSKNPKRFSNSQIFPKVSKFRKSPKIHKNFPNISHKSARWALEGFSTFNFKLICNLHAHWKLLLKINKIIRQKPCLA